MRLYQHPMSANARAAVMTAFELKVPVELVFVDLRNGEQTQPAFLKMNPNHRVPVLEDGDFHLWESRAIMQYLADKTPGQTLYPTDVRARADVNRWLFWSGQHFAPAIGIFFFENLVKGMIGRGAPDPVELQRGDRLFNEFAAVLDAHLTDRRWISGTSLTLADLSIAAAYGCAAPGNAPVAWYANIQKWFARVQRLEVWQRTEQLARAA
ncbi:MAG TPA: glutathione S-transferase family protein [Steroidobacteraceae bacterium]|nr:glutathione S-transferase family protein [Steroidobacteraceae bacterium]